MISIITCINETITGAVSNMSPEKAGWLSQKSMILPRQPQTPKGQPLACYHKITNQFWGLAQTVWKPRGWTLFGQTDER